MKLLEYNLVKFERTLALQIYYIHEQFYEYIKDVRYLRFENIILKYDDKCIGVITINKDNEYIEVTLPMPTNTMIPEMLSTKPCIFRIFNCDIFGDNEIRDEVYEKIHLLFKNVVEEFKKNYPTLSNSLTSTITTLEI